MDMTGVRMPDASLEHLKATAAGLRHTKGCTINDAVRPYLQRDERRRHRLLETREALADRDAGRVIDRDAVLEWIDSWDMPEEREPRR